MTNRTTNRSLCELCALEGRPRPEDIVDVTGMTRTPVIAFSSLTTASANETFDPTTRGSNNFDRWTVLTEAISEASSNGALRGRQDPTADVETAEPGRMETGEKICSMDKKA